MQLDDLNLFVRVAHTHTLSEAARQLDQTPAAVSARLKRIEKELGVRLVERTTRSLRLTSEGERFLQTSENIASVWTTGQALLRQDARAVEGRIHIAAPSDTSAQFLAKWVSEYTRTYPKLAVTLQVGDRMHDIPREAVDIAIRHGSLLDSSLVSRLLVRTHRVVVASPEYARNSAPVTRPSDLLSHRCLAWLSRDQPKVNWTFGSAVGPSETIVVKPALCGDGLLVRQWALDGDGVAYKAWIDVAEDVRAGRLVRLLSNYDGEVVDVNAIMPSGHYVPDKSPNHAGLFGHKVFGDLTGEAFF